MNDVERALLSTISGKLFIAGEWVDATGGATLDVRDPATNEVIAQVADATADDWPRTLWTPPSMRRPSGRRPARAGAARSCAAHGNSCRSGSTTSRSS